MKIYHKKKQKTKKNKTKNKNSPKVKKIKFIFIPKINQTSVFSIKKDMLIILPVSVRSLSSLHFLSIREHLHAIMLVVVYP